MSKSTDTRHNFISYARDDDEPFVKQLYLDLIERGYNVWWDRQAMESRGRTFLQEIRDAIVSAERLILVIGPKAIVSHYVQVEWQLALEVCTAVLPILRLGDEQRDEDYELVPMELRALHCPDFRQSRPYNEALQELLRLLDTPVPLLGALHGVNALPANYLPRPDEISRLSELMLADVSSPTVITSAQQTTALQGMGGIGKSVLAAAFARVCETRRDFEHGIVWLNIGREPNLVASMRLAGGAFDDKPEHYLDSNGAAARLAHVLSDKNCLLILDDVWEIGHAETFLNALGPRCRLLLTTRDGGLVHTLGAQHFPLELLSEPQALALLAGWAGQNAKELPAEAEEVARECGYLPLALAMAGAMAKGKPDRWLNILHRLRTADLDKIRRQFPNYPYPDLLRAIQVSVDALEEDVRDHYFNLAVFPKGSRFPETALQVLWEPEGLDEYDIQDLVDLLVDRSLLQRSGKGRLTLHDLQYDYLLKQNTDLGSLHNQILDAYAKRCPDGWASGPDDGYFFQSIDYHLKGAGRANELRQLLLDFTWIVAKLNATDVADLIDDYDAFPDDQSVGAVHKAVRLSAHTLARDKGQLQSQIYGRLMGLDLPEIQQLVVQVRERPGVPWLRSLSFSLRPPGGPLLLTLEGHTSSVRGVAVTRDGHLAISGSMDRTLKVWDLATGQMTRTLQGHTEMVNCVAVSRDGRVAVSTAFDLMPRVWDLETGQTRWTLKGHSDYEEGVAVSGDGRLAITASYYHDTMTVWDLTTGEATWTLTGHSARVRDIAVSDDGRLAVSASNDKTLKVWDLMTGEATRTLTGHTEAVARVAVSDDGRLAVSASHDRTLKVWDLTTGRAKWTFEGGSGYSSDYVHGVAVSANGLLAVSASSDGTLKVWDLAMGEIKRTLKWNTLAVEDVALSGDGQLAVVASMDGTLTVWDLMAANGTLETARETLSQERHEGRVGGVALSGDGRLAVSASGDKTLKVWELSAALRGTQVVQKSTWTLAGHTDAVVDVALTGDARRAISVSYHYDGTLKVWDLTTGKAVRTLPLRRSSMNGLAVTADGRLAVTALYQGTLDVWDLALEEEVCTLVGHEDQVWGVALSPDGRLAISASADRTLKVWDIAGIPRDAGRARVEATRTLRGHTDEVFSVALTGDGRWAVSASKDGTLQVWDLSIILKAIPSTEQVTMTLKGHTDGVRSVAVSSDGRLAASASFDRTLRVWDLAMGETITTFSVESPLYCCAVSSDGKIIVAGERYGRVHFLRLEE